MGPGLGGGLGGTKQKILETNKTLKDEIVKYFSTWEI